MLCWEMFCFHSEKENAKALWQNLFLVPKLQCSQNLPKMPLMITVDLKYDLTSEVRSLILMLFRRNT